MKKFYILLILVSCFMACEDKKPVPADPVRPATSENVTIEEEWVAQVGPEKITKTQFEKHLLELDTNDKSFVETPAGKHNFIQLLVREKLASLDAKDQHLDATEEYRAALADKRAQLHAIYQAYADQLLLHVWEENQRTQGNLQVTDEEIAAYHKKYPYEMTIKQIIIDDAATADIVWKALRRAKNRWRELERQYSVAPKRSRGKELSFMPGEFIPELEVIAANSPVSSVQGFVKTSQGFHIIMKTGEKRLSLKDAAPRIRVILENQKMDALLESLQEKYKVVIYEQNN